MHLKASSCSRHLKIIVSNQQELAEKCRKSAEKLRKSAETGGFKKQLKHATTKKQVGNAPKKTAGNAKKPHWRKTIQQHQTAHKKSNALQ